MSTAAPSAKRHTPSSPHLSRLGRLRALIVEARADILLVTNPVDVGYLTGFLGGDSYLLVPAEGRPLVVSDFRYQEELAAIAPVADVLIRTKGLADAAADVLAGLRPKRVAAQGEHIPVAEFSALKERLKSIDLIASTGLVARLRRQKDAAEVALIRAAIRIQEQALEAILPTIRPGQTELAVAARLEAEMKTRGASEPGFKTIVASKAAGSLPHYRPGPSRLAINKTVLIDWGAVYEGYHGDMTRVFTLGKWPAKIREIYQIVLDAQQAAAAALAPGQHTHAIDAIARAHITKHGYGEHFGHGLGHGMGLNGHEDPRLNPLFPDDTLRPGDVVTVEPGIYLPGVGGVRLEDDYLITERSAENLCRLPKDLRWATL
ncbi:MAG: Xaa-Pro peptidase family protein [Phycisphaerales bacterium]